MKAGGEAILTEYDKKDGKWAWKDTYVFVMDCAAGTVKAHPNPQVKGMKLTDLKDKATGKEFGTALCDAAKKANGGWVEYMWTKPGAEGNHRKVAYVLSAGNYAGWPLAFTTTRWRFPNKPDASPPRFALPTRFPNRRRSTAD
ncbi:MAG: cache domain-containing protein [Candidatus Competibacter sp.]